MGVKVERYLNPKIELIHSATVEVIGFGYDLLGRKTVTLRGSSEWRGQPDVQPTEYTLSIGDTLTITKEIIVQ